MNSVLITGVTGYIGRNLAAVFVAQGVSVHGVVRPRSDTTVVDSRVHLIVYDDGVAGITEYMRKYKISTVVHLAALVQGGPCPPDLVAELVSANVVFGTEIAQASADAGVEHFIATGTFWQNMDGTAYDPVNLYAATKQAFWDILKYYHAATEMNILILKLNDTYGPCDQRRKITTLWLEKLASHEPLMMSSGRQVMDMLHIDDVVSAFQCLISHIETHGKGTDAAEYFVSSDHRCTLREMAQVFEAATGCVLNIQWGALPERPRKIEYPSPSGRIVPGWRCRIGLEEGFRGVYQAWTVEGGDSVDE